MEEVQELIKIFNKISAKTGHGSWTCFNKFLDVALEATNRLKIFDLQWKPELGEFEPAREELHKAYAILLKQVYPEETYKDVIGDLYMALGAADRRSFAQYFTPWHVAQMMAQITIGKPDLQKYTPQQPMTICDPACGSGIMLLAAASVLPRPFIDEGRVAFYGMDIDHTCVKMTRLNMALYGLDRPAGFVKPTQELTEKEIQMLPEPHKTQLQQTLFDISEYKKAA